MASKQLGKFRQWAGEVISSKDKTVVTDEFRELEQDVALRKHGIDRLLTSSKAYHHSLAKKKDSDALTESDKFLPLDALGVVMISHGEQFGEDSAFGSSLVKFGRAHCKIATLQEAYALTLEDTYLASLEKSADELRDYQSQRKKLESRRLAFDAAMSKAERAKTSKKEKDKKEADEELVRARLRYEETSEDVHARMYGIQENEIRQLRDLSGFLDIELKFAEQYLEVLREVKADWVEESTILLVESNRPSGPSHSFRRPLESDVRASGAIRTVKSSSNLGGQDRGRRDQDGSGSDADDDYETANSRASSRSRTHSRRKSDGRPKSSGGRPSSSGGRLDRSFSSGSVIMKRSNSVKKSEDEEVDEEKEKEKEKEKRSRKLSVGVGMGLGMVGSSLGWASEKVSSVTGSVTGRGKKDRTDRFSSLRGRDSRFGGDDFDEDDDEDGHGPEEEDESTDGNEDNGRPHTPHSQVSRLTGKNNKGSPSLMARAMNKDYFTSSSSVSSASSAVPPTKWVRALYDFNGGSAEDLKFRTGDEIKIVSQVADGWCMGELNGRKALFPVSYTEACIPSSLSRSRPSPPELTNNNTSTPKITATQLPEHDSEADLSDMDEVRPFQPQFVATRSPMNGFFDRQSISSVDGESEIDAFSPKRNLFSDVPPTPADEGTGFLAASQQQAAATHTSTSNGFLSSTPRIAARPSPSIASSAMSSSSSMNGSTGSGGSNSASPSTSGKKAPPPPPARRSTGNVLAPPPLPSRPPPVRARSTSGIAGIALPGLAAPAAAAGRAASPFE